MAAGSLSGLHFCARGPVGGVVVPSRPHNKSCRRCANRGLFFRLEAVHGRFGVQLTGFAAAAAHSNALADPRQLLVAKRKGRSKDFEMNSPSIYYHVTTI